MNTERFNEDYEYYKSNLEQAIEDKREVNQALRSYCMGYCDMINHINTDMDGMYLIDPVLDKITELSIELTEIRCV